MNRMIMIWTTCFFLMGPLFATELVQSQKFGFEMEGPEPNEMQAASLNYLIMSLPAVDGFAPNVNVQIQKFSGTMQEYLDLTESQFNQAGIKVLKKSFSESELLLEYSGRMNRTELHWSARAIKHGGKIFLLTATDLERNWEISAARLNKSIQSFKLKGGDQ